jgi:phenylpropionate dioxygenase-like ring-hydroxylating dioxygenase large terminal subunit
MSEITRTIATGAAYGRAPGVTNRALTETGPGTRMGELLRRYWHPVALSTEATAIPKPIRALSEDLILFRDGAGRPGLVHSRCAHRGTTLYYGKVEERGIRCCYHGWLFDVEGNCLDQPCEPVGGLHKDKIRQPWYPVEERYGMVFAYMGPPEKQPALPRWDIMEALAPGEIVVADDNMMSGDKVIPCSWTHHLDNIPDHYHVPILHGSISGIQFGELLGRMPAITWEYTDKGLNTIARRRLDDGKILLRIDEGILPNIRVIPDPGVWRYGQSESISWLLPVDDTHYMLYAALRKAPGWSRTRTKPGGKHWIEMTAAEHQRHPDDFEAQTGQGPLTLHSEEHLATTDTGVVMLRRMLLQQADAVAAGADPIGVSFDPSAPVTTTDAGNFLLEG